MINQETIKVISEQSLLFLIIMSRLTTTFATLSFFKRELVPIKITLLLCIVLTLFLLTYGALKPNAFALTSANIFLTLIIQLALGFVTGFIINMFIDVFLALGQVISVQSGLGFVNLFIPRVGTITPLSHFFFITSALIFFELNGHLVLIKMIIDSYQVDLLEIRHVNMELVREVMFFTKIIFCGSLMLSLPVLIALLISNITIAIMTKFSPQLNIFSIGINISLITCFFVVYICFDAILENGKILLNDIMSFNAEVVTNLFK
jgi:flagellar biosynthesis protein FliR